MENVAQFWNNAFTSMSDVMNTTAGWPLWLAAAVLLILTIVLIYLLAVRSYKCKELNKALEEAGQKTEEIQEENRRALDECEARMEEALRLKDRMLDEQRETARKLTREVEELTRFKERYAGIPDAEAEAARMIQEAKKHAYLVSEQTELEYAEVIEHANQEAESIRQSAQQRLARSHETLKAALARAHEIVEDAHAQAMRISGVTFVAPPNLIEAPAKDSAGEQQALTEEKIETEKAEELFDEEAEI